MMTSLASLAATGSIALFQNFQPGLTPLENSRLQDYVTPQRIQGYPMTTQHMTIGLLSRLTDTKVETIRFYEKSGLLPEPARTEGNYRSYEPTHLNRLSFIRRARDLGFSLDQVRTLLDLSDDRSRPCEAVDEIAKEHLAQVERKISDLKALQRELDRLISQCRCGTVADCRIIETLSPTSQASKRSRA